MAEVVGPDSDAGAVGRGQVKGRPADRLAGSVARQRVEAAADPPAGGDVYASPPKQMPEQACRS